MIKIKRKPLKKKQQVRIKKGEEDGIYRKTLSLQKKITELVQLSLPDRIKSFSLLLRELNGLELLYVYQQMVDSIFGINQFDDDWGIFNPSSENETLLKAFLEPKGLLLQTACDLVAKKVRLQFNHEVLPKAMQNNLIVSTGFYDNLVELNENRTEIINFSINPFEYYMVCFATVGCQVYFEMPVDLDDDNGPISFYQTLATEYFNMYLPTSPTAEIVPFMSNESLRPYRKNTPETPVLCLPILDIFEILTHKPNISFFDVEDFRVESVLRFFMDIWFCNDIKSTKDLPSAYFLKLQREFIKHISAFSIPYKDEGLYMICVRENSLCLLKNRFHSYIWKLFRYWPLDKTYIFVLKIWLRYLEPWAAEVNNDVNEYVGEEEERNQGDNEKEEEEQSQVQVSSTFVWNERVQNFFKENLEIYTQIFLDVLPCLEKLDYFSDSNIQMLKMVIDFFGNEDFMWKLKETEQLYLNKLNKEQLEGVFRGMEKKCLMVTRFQDWDQLFIQSEYVPAFNTYTLIMFERIVKSLYTAIIDTKMKIIELDTQIDKVSDSKPLLDIFLNTRRSLIRKIEMEMAANTETLCKLTYIVDNFKETIFQTEIPEIPSDTELVDDQCSEENVEEDDSTATPNILHIKPKHCRYLFCDICANVDPACSPKRFDECKPVLDLMQCFSNILNNLIGKYVDAISNRKDIIGRIIRSIPFVLPSVKIHQYNRRKGIQELNEIRLPARISFRLFGSYWAIVPFLICAALYYKDIRYSFLYFLVVTVFIVMKYIFNYLFSSI